MARKISGGKYKKARKKKLFECRGKSRLVQLGPEKKLRLRIMGGKIKTVLFSTDKANLLFKDGKIKVVKIKAVLEIPSNVYLKNVLFKGAVIDTEAGKARITNRPSQEGAVNAKLI